MWLFKNKYRSVSNYYTIQGNIQKNIWLSYLRFVYNYVICLVFPNYNLILNQATLQLFKVKPHCCKITFNLNLLFIYVRMLFCVRLLDTWIFLLGINKISFRLSRIEKCFYKTTLKSTGLKSLSAPFCSPPEFGHRYFYCSIYPWVIFHIHICIYLKHTDKVAQGQTCSRNFQTWNW